MSSAKCGVPIALAMLLQACIAAAPPPAAPRSLEAEVRERSRAVAAAEATENLESIMPFWMSDAVVHVEGSAPVVGHAAIRKIYEQLFPVIESFRAETSRVAVAGGGDLAYETGTNYLVLASKAGPVTASSKYLVVWKRGTDAEWRIAALSLTNNPTQQEAVTTTHASGTFDVKLSPQAPTDQGEEAAVGRMLADKRFHGDLEGTSKGQMLAAGTEVKGSAGYVAIERVTGALRGKSGTFVLQHSGTMTRGAPELSVTVVPDSGTGQLLGLTGRMTIEIVDGKHLYKFDYTLP